MKITSITHFVVRRGQGSRRSTGPGEEVSNTISGTIQLRTFLGPLTRFIVETPDNATLTADIPSKQAGDFYVAQNVVLAFLPGACQVLPLTSNKQRNALSGEKAETY